MSNSRQRRHAVKKARKRANRQLRRYRLAQFDTETPHVARGSQSVVRQVNDTVKCVGNALGIGVSEPFLDNGTSRNTPSVGNVYRPQRPSGNRKLFCEWRNHAVQTVRLWISRGSLRTETLLSPIRTKQCGCINVSGKVRAINTVVVRVNNGWSWEIKPRVARSRAKKRVKVVAESVDVSAVDVSLGLRHDIEQRAILARKKQRSAAHDQRLGPSC